jgi:hypothetical protein
MTFGGEYKPGHVASRNTSKIGVRCCPEPWRRSQSCSRLCTMTKLCPLCGKDSVLTRTRLHSGLLALPFVSKHRSGVRKGRSNAMFSGLLTTFSLLEHRPLRSTRCRHWSLKARAAAVTTRKRSRLSPASASERHPLCPAGTAIGAGIPPLCRPAHIPCV